MRLYLSVLFTAFLVAGCGSKGSVYATTSTPVTGTVTQDPAVDSSGGGSNSATSYSGVYKVPGYNITLTITDNGASLSLYINYEDLGSSVGGTLTQIQSDEGSPNGFALPTFRNPAYNARKLNNLNKFENTPITIQEAGVINGVLSVYFTQDGNTYGAPKVQ